MRALLLVVLVGAMLPLLVACATSRLYSSRGPWAGREIAVRALGAGRGRIARQLITESVIIALLGGAVRVRSCSSAS